MFYTDDWVFFHVPKTSGTNILERSQAKVGHKHRLERHNPVWYWEDRFDLSQKKYYSVVRHPYTRAVSLWSYVTGQKITFEEFIHTDKVDVFKWFDRVDGLDILWDLRSKQCDLLNSRVKVFKIETELPLLEQELGFGFTDSRSKVGVYGVWKKWYNEDIAKKVYELFYDDFEAFGYSNTYK